MNFINGNDVILSVHMTFMMVISFANTDSSMDYGK